MAASLASMSVAPTPGPASSAQEDLVVDECGEEILPSLNASIAEVRSKVEEWAMSQKDALDSVHRSYAEELQTFREQRSELQEREATLREEAVQLSRELWVVATHWMRG